MGGISYSRRGIGVGQVWQDVTSSRSSGANYTNDTGRTIIVRVYQSWHMQFLIDGLKVAQVSSANSEGTGEELAVEVPAGSVYRLERTGSPATVAAVGLWTELR